MRHPHRPHPLPGWELPRCVQIWLTVACIIAAVIVFR
jgi:hypothetical protein